MKLSTNFVKDYVDIDVDVKTLAEDMTRVGNEYDSAEKLINATKLTIGKVIECKDHPDSDHLHICKVDIGSEVLNIVCGAPNVREELKVIVALVGAKLPEIEIKKGVIRGQESNGMLCSMAELGLEHKFLDEVDKTGIHELPEDAPIGEDPIKYMGLDDEVIDFELTANRGDLLSILGMAYEIGAIYGKKVKDIDVKHEEIGEDIKNKFTIDIKTDNCSLFLAKKVEGLTIKESPNFIKNRLIASGIRPINNVVDISNYVMLEVGQPLHFYDADRLGDKIVVRMAENGEKLTTLDGQERILDENDIVIADKEKAIGLAGVMGGLTTEVENNTKNIIIESAIFDSVKVRLASKKVVRSEASNRFEKGLDPNRTYLAVERACNLLEKYADAKIITGVLKFDKTEKEDKEIKINLENINRVLGTNITVEDAEDVYRKLDFKCSHSGDEITVVVPRRRLDINIKEDLIEEVSRIYGVDNIKGKLPILTTRPGKYNRTHREIRNKMISLGLNETLSYVLVNKEEAVQYAINNLEPINLLDPITEDRSTLRTSIIPSLMKIYEYNKARSEKDVSIFEIGKSFGKDNEQYIEENKLGVLMTGKYYDTIEMKQNVDFYVVKGVAEEILNYLGYENRYSFVAQKDKMSKEFHPGQTALISVNNDIVGIIGKVHPSIVNEDVFVLEINLDKLLSKKVGKMKFKEISKFPSVNKDLAIVVDKDIEAQTIAMQIKKSGGSILNDIKIFDIYTGKGIDENKKSIAYSLTLGKMNATLTDEEINACMEKIIKDLENKLGAELRK